MWAWNFTPVWQSRKVLVAKTFVEVTRKNGKLAEGELFARQTISRVAVATKLGIMVAYLNRLLPIKSHDRLLTWCCGSPDKVKQSLRLKKFCRMVTYLEWLLTIKSLNPLSHGLTRSHGKQKVFYLHYQRVSMITKLSRHETLTTRSCQITRQTKTIVSPIPQWLWLTNLVRWWLNLGCFHP